MEILDTPEYHEVIAWLSHGRGFHIYLKNAFESKILPRHFSKQSKFSSFMRKLNRWGFTRVVRGPETGAYVHPCFRRGDHRVAMQMSCQSISKGDSVKIGGAMIPFATLDTLPKTMIVDKKLSPAVHKPVTELAGQQLLRLQQLTRHRALTDIAMSRLQYPILLGHDLSFTGRSLPLLLELRAIEDIKSQLRLQIAARQIAAQSGAFQRQWTLRDSSAERFVLQRY
jgi:hypothetical protein